MTNWKTDGNEKEKLSDMAKGDYIRVQLNDLDNWLFGIEVKSTTEMPMTAYPFSKTGNAYQEYFYVIKVDQGLLIADRLLFRQVSWNQLNSEKLIEGRTLINKPFIKVRSLAGGVSYGIKDLNLPSMTPVEGPAYPNDNEWDKYVVKNRNWFYLVNSPTWCKETPIVGAIINKGPGQGIHSNSQRRISRGSSLEFSPQLDTDLSMPYSNFSGSTSTQIGFRPVIEFDEKDVI